MLKITLCAVLALAPLAASDPAAAQTRTERWSETTTLPSPVTKDGAPAAASTTGIGLCRKGAAVSVLYGGKWYAAKVLDGPDRMGTCLVSYDGFGSNWDEWVADKRMRPLEQKAASSTDSARDHAQPASSSRDARAKAVPPGKYSCYTFDAGQLNYAYTDVIIESGNRYSIGRGKGGTYVLSAEGGMTFTGPLSNAAGRFSMKQTGKAQIDLIFNKDARASMSCS